MGTLNYDPNGATSPTDLWEAIRDAIELHEDWESDLEQLIDIRQRTDTPMTDDEWEGVGATLRASTDIIMSIIERFDIQASK